jgi:hypothetical protein
LPNTSSILYWVLATDERFEEFEDGNIEIVEGKRGTEEVEPLINFHT